jgi:predicted DNA-binding transcriptional regulator AlpA
VGRHVAIDDLLDATAVAARMGLSHRNSVTTYMARYKDFPRPVIDTGPKRCRLWSRVDIDGWMKSREDAGKVRAR